MYFSLIMMKIPLLAFGSNCDKVIQRCRCHQVYSDLLLTAMHSSVHASTSASCLLLPVVLGVPAHRGLVHGVPACHGCLLARCRWFLEFQIVTVAWFTGFKAVTVALFTGFQLVTDVFLLAVARFLYIIQAFVVLLFDSFILVTSGSCLGSNDSAELNTFLAP
jgi:hypothetical protein